MTHFAFNGRCDHKLDGSPLHFEISLVYGVPGGFLTTGYTAVGKPLPVVAADEKPDVHHCSGHTADVAVDSQQVQS